MNEIKQLFNQTLIYGFSSVVARILNFFLVPLYTVLFMPSEYAIVAEMYAYAALLIVLGSFGMETAFFRFSKNKNETKVDSNTHASKVFSSSFLFLTTNAIILFLSAFFFSEIIAEIIRYENHPEYIRYFLAIVGIDLISIIPFALLRQKNKAIKFASIKTINIVINISLNLIFLLLLPRLQPSFEISVEYVFLSNLIASTITVFLLLPEIKKNFAQPDFTFFKKMIYYSWPILIAGIAFIINETADKILLKYLLQPQDVISAFGKITNMLATTNYDDIQYFASSIMSDLDFSGTSMQKLGVYSACYKLTIFMTLFVQAYRFAAEPFFFNQFKKPNAKKIYALMMQVFVLLSLLIFLFVMLYIDIIKFILPHETSSGEISYHDGIPIIPILLMANIFLGIYYNLSVWYKVTNKTKYAASISSIGATITIIINIIFIPQYGYMASAWATLICYASMVLISFYFGQQNFKIKYNLKSIFGYFLFAISLLILSSLVELKAYNYLFQYAFNTILFTLYSIFIYMQIKKLIKAKQTI